MYWENLAGKKPSASPAISTHNNSRSHCMREGDWVMDFEILSWEIVYCTNWLRFNVNIRQNYNFICEQYVIFECEHVEKVKVLILKPSAQSINTS